MVGQALTHNTTLTVLNLVGNKPTWGNIEGRFCRRDDFSALEQLDEGLAPGLRSMRQQYVERVRRWKKASLDARSALHAKKEPYIRKLGQIGSELEALKIKNEETQGECFQEIVDFMAKRGETQEEMRVCILCMWGVGVVRQVTFQVAHTFSAHSSLSSLRPCA